jgi:hypothetical protein
MDHLSFLTQRLTDPNAKMIVECHSLLICCIAQKQLVLSQYEMDGLHLFIKIAL